jgi:hypothetical protein
MANDVLARSKVLGNSERVDVVVGVQHIGRSPLSIGSLATLVNLEPYSTEEAGI